MRIFRALINVFKNMKQAKKIRSMDSAELLKLDDDDFFDAVECVCRDAVYDINESDIPLTQKYVYSLIEFEAEVNNGGLCQFFVNSSSECAPYISDALGEIGAADMKALFDNFIGENNIDVTDLSSFKIESVEDYEDQTERFDFDSFDDKFYEDENFHELLVDYARKNIKILLKP